MDTTCTTLIRRVIAGGDPIAWGEFSDLYTGLIYRYARARGLNDTDAEDVVGDCMASLSSRMSEFDYDPQRCKFRTYLRSMVARKVAETLRKKRPKQAEAGDLTGALAPHEAPDESWERQWEISHMLFCWERVEQEVTPVYADAFRLFVIEELPAATVAEKLGITANHVYQIKSRMTQRIREVMSEVIGEED
jgi:RNA polymerase sigma-70 factor (ECF subfamily)